LPRPALVTGRKIDRTPKKKKPHADGERCTCTVELVSAALTEASFVGADITHQKRTHALFPAAAECAAKSKSLWTTLAERLLGGPAGTIHFGG